MALDNNASLTWKAILRIRDKLAENCYREFGSGKDTNLWKDPWINDKSLVDTLGRDTFSAFGYPNLTVESIMRNNTWHCESIPCTEELERQIDFMPLYFNKESDIWSWNHGIDFSTKTTWKILRMRHHKMEWSKIIWDRASCPKMALTTYKAMLGQLLTRD